MPLIEYVSRNFKAASLLLIDQCNEIIEEYAAQGYDLTLRQLYYQMVSRDIIPNNLNSYKNLGSIVNDARLAGMIDWNRIVDRTRNLHALSHWDNPAEIIDSARHSFRLDRWADQDFHVECWVEKDALIGVVERACHALDMPFFACRGYSSQSEMWAASQRLIRHGKEGKMNVILYLGDHDPSGLDMTRDVTDRLDMFMIDEGFVATVERLALNWGQIKQYNPPPNPTKLTDSRSESYLVVYGDESWELDALEPTVINSLITNAASKYINRARWNAVARKESTGRELLRDAAERWDEIAQWLSEN